MAATRPHITLWTNSIRLRQSWGTRSAGKPSLVQKSYRAFLPPQVHTCLFHSAPPSLARRTRERNRLKPPIHPSVPSYKLSPAEPSLMASSRRKLMGIKNKKNLDAFAWKKDSTMNVLRRRDGVSGKFTHAKVDWIGDPRRKFLRLKREEKIAEEDARYVSRKTKGVGELADESANDDSPIAHPPKQIWKLQSRDWNRGAPSLVHEYGRERNPIYTHEQRKCLAELRERALEHEKRRLEIMSTGDSSGLAADEELLDYEANFRSPLYDFFRGGQVLEENTVSDANYCHWSVAQLRKKSFEDLQILWYVLLKERNLLLAQRIEGRKVFGKMINPALPPEPLSTIRKQLKLVQFSLRNIKVTVSERQRAIQARSKFLAKFQKKRARSPESQQWLLALEIEKQKMLQRTDAALTIEQIEDFFQSVGGRDRIANVLASRGLKDVELKQNMMAFEQYMETVKRGSQSAAPISIVSETGEEEMNNRA